MANKRIGPTAKELGFLDADYGQICQLKNKAKMETQRAVRQSHRVGTNPEH